MCDEPPPLAPTGPPLPPAPPPVTAGALDRAEVVAVVARLATPLGGELPQAARRVASPTTTSPAKPVLSGPGLVMCRLSCVPGNRGPTGTLFPAQPYQCKFGRSAGAPAGGSQRERGRTQLERAGKLSIRPRSGRAHQSPAQRLTYQATFSCRLLQGAALSRRSGQQLEGLSRTRSHNAKVTMVEGEQTICPVAIG
jgi:hypothetical protein